MYKYFVHFIILVVTLLSPFITYAGSTDIVNIHQEFNAFKQYFPFNPALLKLALEAYNCAVVSGHCVQREILTIVDYQLPSYDKRLWVLNLRTHRLLYHTYVAHGAGSGIVTPTHFSNIMNSLDSSIGLYETGISYMGDYGYAMRLYGLDRGYNNNAYKRAIVFHGGDFVSDKSIEEHGMIGMTHGCFAVPSTLDYKIINTLKNGSLIFAYYPNPGWLSHSEFLHCSVLQHQA